MIASYVTRRETHDIYLISIKIGKMTSTKYLNCDIISLGHNI